jgi:hypothetical protein
MKAPRPLLALALLCALTGCVSSPPPNGTLVEYRPGQPATTQPVTCEANYVLVARDAAGPPGPFGEHHLRKGERVGFRCEPDGSVTAIAPGYTIALPSGSYAWEVVPSSVPSLRDRQVRDAREHLATAGRITGIALVATAAVIGVLTVVFIIAVATSDSFLKFT